MQLQHTSKTASPTAGRPHIFHHFIRKKERTKQKKNYFKAKEDLIIHCH